MSAQSPLEHRYLVFAGKAKEARGGWNDFLSGHPTLDAARLNADTKKRFEPNSYEFDWAHILDTEKGQIVAERQSNWVGSGGWKLVA